MRYKTAEAKSALMDMRSQPGTQFHLQFRIWFSTVREFRQNSARISSQVFSHLHRSLSLALSHCIAFTFSVHMCVH